MSPWTTTRKVYADGVRISEMPLKRAPQDHLPDIGATLSTPHMTKKRRRMFRRLPWGAVPGYAPICVDSNDPDTVRDAFLARLMRPVPKFDPVVLAEFKKFVETKAASLPTVDVGSVSFEEWIDTRPSYNEQRKEQLRTAFASLRGGAPTKKQCRRISAFIKTEGYPCFKHGRMINSRSDEWKAFAGPYISAVESIVYQLPQFIKHTPVPERPALINALYQHGRNYFMTDFTAFESHFVPEVMDACENALFRHVLKNWKYVDLLCDTNAGPNHCSTRIGVKGTVTARRMSGDMWTSLGNGWTNWCLAEFIAHKQGHKLYGYVEGDDGIFATKAVLTKQLYEQLGFTIKIEQVPDPRKGSPTMAFCGMVFAESGQILRDPRRVLQQFGWTSSFINAGEEIMLGLLKSKALSGKYETPDCPIVGVLYEEALSRTGNATPIFTTDGFHTAPPIDAGLKPFAPTLQTRLLFEELYGITVPQQLSVETAIRSGDMSYVTSVIPPMNDMLTYSNGYVTVT